MMNSHPLLSLISYRRVSCLSTGALLLVLSTAGFGPGAIAAPQASFDHANKDALSDLLESDNPLMDAVNSVLGEDAEQTEESTTSEDPSEETTRESTDGTIEESAAETTDETATGEVPTDTSTESTTEADTTTTARFTCQYQDGEFVVMYSPESEPSASYEWAIPGEMGGGWTPENRCNAIAERLEAYRPDGLLELQTSEENNYNTVCATTSNSPGCRIVFTVPDNQDPVATRDRVFENLAIANSGQETTGVTTFTGNNDGSILSDIGSELGLDNLGLPTGQQPSSSLNHSGGIDLRPFLDPADGGTGSRL